MNALDLAIIAIAIGAGLGGWRLGLVARVFAWAGVFTGLAIGVQLRAEGGDRSGREQRRWSHRGRALVPAARGADRPGVRAHGRAPRPPRVPDRESAAAVGPGRGSRGRRCGPAGSDLAGHSLAGDRTGLAVAHGSRLVAGRRDPTRGAESARPVRGVGPRHLRRAVPVGPRPAREAARSRLRADGDAGPRGRCGGAAFDRDGDRGCVQPDPRREWLGRRAAKPSSPMRTSWRGSVRRASSTTPVSRAASSSSRSTRWRDLAVLSVPGLSAAPLRLANGSVGAVGAVYGHPGGGSLQAAPARIGEEIVAVGTNIYRTSTSRRNVYVLASRLAPGDSGGALVNRSGAVVGVAFAIDPGRSGTSYALTNKEVRPTLEAANNAAAVADTGACLVE